MVTLTIEVTKVLLVLVGVLNLAAILTWMERAMYRVKRASHRVLMFFFRLRF